MILQRQWILFLRIPPSVNATLIKSAFRARDSALHERWGRLTSNQTLIRKVFTVGRVNIRRNSADLPSQSFDFLLHSAKSRRRETRYVLFPWFWYTAAADFNRDYLSTKSEGICTIEYLRLYVKRAEILTSYHVSNAFISILINLLFYSSF